MKHSIENPPCLFLFREDLRLTDNPSLMAAIKSKQPVICIFIYDDTSDGPWRAGSARKWWLHYSLRSLMADIEELGGKLILLEGKQEILIPQIVLQTNSTQVFWTRRYGPQQIEVDKNVKSKLESDGVKVTSTNGRLLFEPWHFKTGTRQPYRVFTPLWKAMKATGVVRPLCKKPSSLNWAEHNLNSIKLDELKLLPTSPNWASQFPQEWHPGESGAKERLVRFIKATASKYRDERNRPDISGTSGLSPHLQHGEISPVQIWHSIQIAVEQGRIPEAQADVFLSEIAWREFSYVLLFNNPDMLSKEINPKFNNFPWQFDVEKFNAWKSGNTGYPIVDAGMRELWQTGWMHNRVRMIVGSFLVKHLLVDWRDGMAWFWDTLLDADIASNTASWQWIAGCGADAAPYFRIFNPILQGQKFDPNGEYIRKFLPQLKNLPDKYISAPWEAPNSILHETGIVLGRNYPRPIIDLKEARDKALEAYEKTKT